jgi:hypothetical protein
LTKDEPIHEALLERVNTLSLTVKAKPMRTFGRSSATQPEAFFGPFRPEGEITLKTLEGNRRKNSTPCTLMVTGWNDSSALLLGLEGRYAETMFMRLLMMSTPMSRLEAKTVVKKIAARQPVQALLSDDRYADAMCFSLQRIGGEIQLHKDARPSG